MHDYETHYIAVIIKTADRIRMNAITKTIILEFNRKHVPYFTCRSDSL